MHRPTAGLSSFVLVALHAYQRGGIREGAEGKGKFASRDRSSEVQLLRDGYAFVVVPSADPPRWGGSISRIREKRGEAFSCLKNGARGRGNSDRSISAGKKGHLI